MDIISPALSVTPPAPPFSTTPTTPSDTPAPSSPSTSSPPPSSPPPPPPPDTLNAPPPAPPETPNVPPPSPLATIASPVHISPPPLSEISPPPPLDTIASSPPEPQEKKPKKSKKSNSEPPTISPPSIVYTTPPPLAISPPFSPPVPLATSSGSGKETANSALHSPIESSNVRANNASEAKTGTATGIGIVVGFLALTLVLLTMWFKRKRKRNRDGLYANYVLPSLASSQKSDSSFLKPQSSDHLSTTPSRTNSMYSQDSGGVGNSRSSFTYEEIVEATKGFSKNNILGEGGYGCVFKGVLVDGREIAVKQLKATGGQGEREFRAEVEIISRVHHRHLVSLVGYCISENQRLLVLDFVPNGTLHYHLHSKSRPVMGWATRVRVAAGAARGLAYLHEDCHPRIIHRDIKSSNILLDINLEAQVADFGLAKLTTDTKTHVSTRVMGTFGYLAPEYAASGKLTEKSDVFSFGVVLLELITGRVPVDSSRPYGDESLVEWARPLLTEALEKENFDELVDSRLGKNYVASEMFQMVEAAAACIRHSALKRPKMSQVVRALDSLDEISGLSNGAKIGESVLFNSREQSAQIKMFRETAFGSQEYSSGFSDRSRSGWKS